MEMEMHPHQWARRMPDWQAAVVSGLVAGAVLMVLEMLWSASVARESPWRISHLVAAMALGEDTLQSSAFSVAVVAIALATHYLLGIVFGLVLAFIVAGFHYETHPGMLQFIGAVFGAALYLFNFHGMSTFFPWIAELRSWATFIAHLLFGMAVALTYWQLERRGGEE
jgi:hypothetical protein